MNKNLVLIATSLVLSLSWVGCNKSGKLNEHSTFKSPSGPVELKLKWPVGERIEQEMNMKMKSETSIPGRPGMEVSDFIFMFISCSIRSPTGHFNFNSTGPLGDLKVECSFSLPDLLQPTQDRLKTSEVAIRTRFLFMVGGFLDC